MSRAYRIQISRDISRVVHVEDGVTSRLELLPILEADRMRDLLVEQLAEEGFEIDGDEASKEIEPGLVLGVNLALSEVSLKVEGEHKLEEKAEVSAWGDTDYGPKKDQEDWLLAREQDKANKRMDKQADKLQKEATQKLEGMLRDMQLDIRRITGEVMKKALKEKAASMGDIDAMSEGTDGSMEIKVKL